MHSKHTPDSARAFELADIGSGALRGDAAGADAGRATYRIRVFLLAIIFGAGPAIGTALLFALLR